MESIVVLYEIVNNLNQIQSINNIRNCFQLSIEVSKEIYLFDIIKYFQKIFQSNNFIYYTVKHDNTILDSNDWILIDSPYNSIPIFEIDRQLIAYLAVVRSTSPVVIIPNQSELFNQSTHKNSDNLSDYTSNFSNNNPTKHKSKPKDSLLQNKNNESISGIQSYVNEESINAIAEAAKEAASNAAKSIFSFATSSLRNVTEAASSISLSNTTIALTKTKITIVKEIAEGGFGKIYLVNDQSNPSKQYAMKSIICQSKDIEIDSYKEIQALELLSNHKNIIKLIDYVMKSNNQSMKTLYLLFPLYNHGTAYDFIQRAHPDDDEYNSVPWPFPQNRIVFMMRQLTSALLYIHDQGFTHRDIKPHNILLCEDFTPILTDFGSIGPGSVKVTTRKEALTIEEEAAMKTSAAYRPPELTTMTYPCVIDERIDIWSLGCTMYCLAFGWSPFESQKEGVKRLAILNGRYSIPSDKRMRDCIYTNEFIDIIKMMLQVNPINRPFTGKVLELLNENSLIS